MKILRLTAIVILLLWGIGNYGVQAADNMATPAVIIDVRTEAEWQSGHLDGAILIPYDKIGEEIGKAVPDKKTKINLYCRSGRRSGIALETLQKLGYVNLSNLGSVETAAKALDRQVVK